MTTFDSADNCEAHPAPEDLLLWLDGEADEALAQSIDIHVRSCSICSEKLRKAHELFGEVSAVKSAAASWNFHHALEEKRSFRFTPFRFATVSTAAGLVIVLFMTSILRLTPSARADELLLSASRYESSQPPRRLTFNLVSGIQNCRLRMDNHQMTTPVSDFCVQAIEHFQIAGVRWDHPLSARSFQQWRSSLSDKEDQIQHFEGRTEITTTTHASPLRKATLRFSKPDLQPISGRFEFAPDRQGIGLAFDVTQAEDEVLETAVVGPPVNNMAPGVISKPLSLPVHLPLDPLDVAELRVRLALHRLRLDRDIVIDVRREKSTALVWGAISHQEIRDQLVNVVKDIPNADIAVSIGDEQTSGLNHLPWQTFRGQGTPLAFEYIKALFPNNPVGRQEFIHALDSSTREIAAVTRSLDALLRLQQEQASPELTNAIEELQREISTNLQVVCLKLQPIAPLQASPNIHLKYSQAIELYELVHEVVYLSRTGSNLTLEQAIQRIHQIIHPFD